MQTPTPTATLPSIYVGHANQLGDLILAAKAVIAGMELGTMAEYAESAPGLTALMDTIHGQATTLAANLGALLPEGQR